MAEEKTHWRKNNDTRYISGETLVAELHGLKKEMVVTISSFKDSETFDQNNQETKIKSGLFLKTLDGKDVYKPVILNTTNSKFLAKEFGSDFLEDWIGKPVTMFAMADKRHGYVVRFKSYKKPIIQLNSDIFNKAKTALTNGGYTIEKLKTNYIISPEVEAELLKPIA
jgi:hypothetical protein